MNDIQAVKRAATVLAMSGVVMFGGAAACEKVPPRDYYPVQFPDCDKDDRSPHWEVSDCGPSPTPAKSRTVPRPSGTKRR